MTAITREDFLNPAAVPGIACLLAAFGFSLFFEGYADIIYAPASLLLLAMALLSFIPACRNSISIPVSGTALLFFAFWLYITLSLTWSTVPFTSLVTYIVFISLPLTSLSFSIAEKRRAWLASGCGGLLVLLGVLGGWAIIQYLFLQEIYGARAHHPLINANNLATLLNLGLLPALALTLSRPQRDTAWYGFLVLAALLYGGLIATQSRSGFLFMLAAVAVLVFMLHRPVREHWKRCVFLGAAGFVLYALMHIQGGGQLGSRIIQLALPLSDTAVQSRLSLWSGAFALFKDNLWTGTGLGTFYLYYPAYRLPPDTGSAGQWVHMDALQLGAETGLAATLLFYLFLTAVLVRTLKALPATAADSWQRAAIAGLFCGLLTLALHAHTSFPLYLMPVLIVSGVWLTAWHYLTGKASYKSLTLTAAEQRIAIGAGIAVVIFVGLMGASSAAGQYYLIKATEEIGKGRVTGFLDNIEKARQWGPSSFIDPNVQIAGFYVDILESGDALFPRSEQQALFRNGLALLDEAETMNPAWAEIDYKRGRLYEVAKTAFVPGSAEKAAEAWRGALRKDPSHERARLALAKHYMTRGNAAAAHDILAAGLPFPMTETGRQTIMALIREIRPLAAMQKIYKNRESRKELPE